MIRNPIVSAKPVPEHARRLTEVLTTAFAGPLLMLIAGAIPYSLTDAPNSLTLALTLSLTYLSALVVKMVFPKLLTQSAAVMSVAAGVSFAAVVFFYFGGTKMLKVLHIHGLFAAYLRMFIGPGAVALGVFANFHIIRRDYGFSGPIDWSTTRIGILLLLLTCFAAASILP